ncbi:MAG: threonine-phosphate decarboxylase CobD [Syntrophobacteraceae bacterium]|jgi:threonine-phosphate decarboxylase|nr:threonine-phosphate decarboxylase CobD [Syntrophobacteraceae bacterium]
MSFPHGGNVYEVAHQLGCSPDAILDFSASINPLGPPAGLWEELRKGYPALQHYPDISNRDLVEALAELHRAAPDQVVVGNGSTELIYWLARALNLERAVVAVPTFSEYLRAFQREGVGLERLVSTEDAGFQPDLEHLGARVAEARPDAVLLTHPGSPSGVLLAPQVRLWAVEACRSQGWTAIIDEAFIDFCEEESLKSLLMETTPLVIIRSMTKFYAIPGLRLGYILTSPELARRIRQLVPPWSINTFAQIAGAYCARQEKYRAETIALVTREREFLAAGLGESGLGRAIPGVANYLLVRMADHLPGVRKLQEDLLHRHRILIRDCWNFDGVGERFFRIAVRLPEQNRRLLAALKEWVETVG